MSETKTDAQVLRDAAAHIRKVGKTSGFYFGTSYDWGDRDDVSQAPCCAVGAVAMGTGVVWYDESIQRAWGVLDNIHDAGAGLPRKLIKWSDDLPDTPEGAETVAKALEAAADKLEASA